MTKRIKMISGAVVITLLVVGLGYAYVKRLKNKRFDAEAKVSIVDKVQRAEESKKEIKRLEEEINAFEVNKADFYKRYDKYLKHKGPRS